MDRSLKNTPIFNRPVTEYLNFVKRVVKLRFQCGEARMKSSAIKLGNSVLLANYTRVIDVSCSFVYVYRALKLAVYIH